jgi:hypothetical protein
MIAALSVLKQYPSGIANGPPSSTIRASKKETKGTRSSPRSSFRKERPRGEADPESFLSAALGLLHPFPGSRNSG